VVCCPQYCRPVLDGLVKNRCEKLIPARVVAHGWQIVTLEVMPD
jgi:REP element-mobilizing transposase RayT